MAWIFVFLNEPFLHHGARFSYHFCKAHTIQLSESDSKEKKKKSHLFLSVPFRVASGQLTLLLCCPTQSSVYYLVSCYCLSVSLFFVSYPAPASQLGVCHQMVTLHQAACSLPAQQLEGGMQEKYCLQTFITYSSTAKAVFSWPFVVTGEKWKMMGDHPVLGVYLVKRLTVLQKTLFVII